MRISDWSSDVCSSDLRRVVRHEIDDQLHAPRVRLRQQPVEVRERAEDRIDIAVIGDVVAEVRHRRGIEGRQPEHVDAEPFQIAEPALHARKIADRSEEHTSELQSLMRTTYDAL